MLKKGIILAAFMAPIFVSDKVDFFDPNTEILVTTSSEVTVSKDSVFTPLSDNTKTDSSKLNKEKDGKAEKK